MAELNLKQITDKLNSEFTGSVRKLVFWYDEAAEFVDDVDTMDLVNAKVLHLEPDNQFYMKYFLECVDTTTNYLVYAPFAKPAIRENHLADTIRYSKEFFADRASLLCLDLGIDDRYKAVIQNYIKFFGDKKRTQAFYDLELETFNRNTIEIALMSVLCKNKTSSFEEVLRTVLTDAGFEENPYLAEFKKYDLLDAFWRLAQDVFGYADANPTLEKFTMTLFVTYADKVISSELPVAWKPFVSFKSGNVIVFLDNLMNSYIYGERFDKISGMVYESLNAATEIQKLPVEELVSCGIFAGIDEILIEWAIERLEMEDISAKLGDITIPQLVKQRRQGHYGAQYKAEYFVLQNAWNLLSEAAYVPTANLNGLVSNYTSTLYKIDRYYRYFYYYLDSIEEASRFDKLKELVENVYANEYLSKVCSNWNDLFSNELDLVQIEKQTEFYSKNVSYCKDQLVVIISDALRYEVGMTLLDRLQTDEKCTAAMKTMMGTLPSITPYGMAALLPHRYLELTDDFDLLVDGQKAETLEQRQQILQKFKPASRCVQYDDIKNLSVADLRSIFTRQDVVYIYHNQIDARGDRLNTENEVFDACVEAVDEIATLIRRLTTSANRSHFIVTADHGFLYRRNKLSESDKIGTIAGSKMEKGRRYIISDEVIAMEGVASVTLGSMLQNDETRKVSYPIGADIFKAPGSGINYVHGGSSPQEMLLPLIEVKTERGFKEVKTVQVDIISLSSKLTNLITSLDFIQTEPVSDVVKETSYRLYFVNSQGEKISNEHLYVADKKDEDTAKRIFKLRFSLKNQKYDRFQKYYLLAIDANNNLEVMRKEYMIDIAMVDDFGFGL